MSPRALHDSVPVLKDVAAKMRGVHWEKLIFSALSMGGSMYLVYMLLQQMDPTRASRQQIEFARRQLKRRLGRDLRLTNLETVIANDIVTPDEVDIGLSDIGGLDSIIARLYEGVVRPLQRPNLFRSSLLKPPRGVLLYGRPGVGKTMLAKVLAKEAGATFINVKVSSVQSKWFGESQKQVAAIFSLAYKVQPAIIFIDEVDGLLGQRRSADHEATVALKTEFMQAWDGLLTSSSAAVLVLGATNRRTELDDAVLRRFALQLEVPMPGEAQRRDILYVTLRKHASDSPHTPVDPALLIASAAAAGAQSSGSLTSANSNGADGDASSEEEEPLDPLSILASRTAGLSGSDLVALCAEAARLPMREHLLAAQPAEPSSPPATGATLYSGNGQSASMLSSDDELENLEIRPLQLQDFLTVLEHFKSSTAPASETEQHGQDFEMGAFLSMIQHFLLPRANGGPPPAAHA